MRISLLLQREPFGQILEETLARFWQCQYGQDYQVRWLERRPVLTRMRRRVEHEQTWLCNIFLNAVFVPDSEREAFDPIRHEFCRSLVKWRRSLQRVYVSVGVSPWGAHLLAQAILKVRPAVPDATRKLIVAGNHKIRLLDHREGLAYSILKAGFTANFIARELEARRLAEQVGLPVPKLESLASDGTWFSERFISGKPINRLADQQEAQNAAFTVAQSLKRLIAATLEEESTQEYANRLQTRIQQHVTASGLLSEEQKREILNCSRALVRQLRHLGVGMPYAGSIATSLTHGDFQLANILVNANHVWLIDWEYAARRQAAYDAMVFATRSRLPAGLAGRLRDFIERGADAALHRCFDTWPGVNWRDVEHRRLHSLVFALEELALHLEENANPCFVQIGAGLKIIQQELSRWVGVKD